MAGKFWNRIKGLFDAPLGTTQADHDAPHEVNPLLKVLGPIEAAREKALEYDDSAVQDKLREQALQAERDQMKTQRANMLEDILALHQKLGTGLGQADLERLSHELHEHLKFFSNRNTDSMADQGLLAILHSIHDKSMEHGWDKLNEAMAKAGLRWPQPLGMSPTASEEEIRVKSELQFARNRQDFIRAPLAMVADEILGIVPAWRSAYPERGAELWTETVYQAIGAAWAAQRWAHVVAVAHEATEEIRAKMAERLAKELEPIQSSLGQGVTSIAQARRLSDEAVTICQKAAPEVLWSVIGPRL